MGAVCLRPPLPSDVASLDDRQLRMIMLHELAHVRRRDVAFNWIVVLIRPAHWWNPIYWLAARGLPACGSKPAMHLSFGG